MTEPILCVISRVSELLFKWVLARYFLIIIQPLKVTLAPVPIADHLGRNLGALGISTLINNQISLILDSKFESKAFVFAHF